MKIPSLPTQSLSHAQTLSSIIGNAEGFTVFAKKEGKKWIQLGALPANQAHRIYDLIPRAEMVDFYFTVNTFYRAGPEMKNGLRKVYSRFTTKEGVKLPGTRQEKNLQDLRCLYVDMDLYRNARPINWRDASNLIMKLADKGVIPHPSYFANSGRGAYAIWTLSPHESKTHDVMNYKALNNALYREFKAYAALLEPDGVFDGSRVLRVPGSINSKAPDNPVGYVVQYDRDGKAYEYTMEGVAGRLGVELVAPRPKAPALPVAIPAPVSHVVPFEAAPKPSEETSARLEEAGRKGMKALGVRRMAELLEIIRAKGVIQGVRYKTLFILASTARIAGIGSAEATETLTDLASGFSPPYPGADANDIDVSQIVRLAYRGEIKKHSAKGLAKFFNLSTEDCRSLLLRTIYTQEIAEIKNAPKRTDKAKLEAAIVLESHSATCLLDLCRRLFARHAISLSKSQASRVVRRLGLKLGHSSVTLAA